MSKLSKKALAADRPTPRRVDVTDHFPESFREAWAPERVYLQEPNARERGEYLSRIASDKAKPDELDLILRCLVDAGGEKVFDLTEKLDLSLRLSSTQVITLSTLVQDLCGFFMDTETLLSKPAPGTPPSSPSATG